MTHKNVIVDSATILNGAVIIAVDFGGSSDVKVYSCKRGWFSDVIVNRVVNIAVRTDGKVSFYDVYNNTLLAELG